MSYLSNGHRLNTIGIDKVKLKCIPIKVYDVSKLYNRVNVTVVEDSLYKREFVTNNGVLSVGQIIIKDDLFNFKTGVKKVDVYKFVFYETIEINPAAIVHGSNINNISYEEELIKALSIIENRLMDYGLEVDLKVATIDEIEINTNFKLKHKFDGYKNVFELIKECLPKPYKKSGSYEDRERGIYTGFKVENKEISLKFYDKFVEKDIIADYSILRIEYRLLTTRNVQAKFGFTTMGELIDNFDMIEVVFTNLVNKDIATKVSKHIKELFKLNCKRLKRIKETEYHYIKHFLAVTQDQQIFDCEIIDAAINKLDISQRNKEKRKIEVRELLKKREANGSNLFFNNLEKVNEILGYLGENTISI